MLKESASGLDEPILTDLERYIVDLPRTLEDRALEATVQLEDKLTEIYKTAPPRTSEKFVWSLDPAKDKKARGWWYWQVRLGNIPTDGRHYQRQGKPPYGASVDIMQMQYSVKIQVRLVDTKMRFTFGQLKSPNTQVIGHQRTGWNYAFPLVNEALEQATNYILDGIAAGLKEI
jgi:hypothetical protein